VVRLSLRVRSMPWEWAAARVMERMVDSGSDREIDGILEPVPVSLGRCWTPVGWARGLRVVWAAMVSRLLIMSFHRKLMEELHTDSIGGGHEASYGARSRARERAYSNKSNDRKEIPRGQETV